MNRKRILGTSAILIGLILAGRIWADPGNGATPAVPGGGNPNANSDNAATPAVPGGGNDKDKDNPPPQAHTTPSGVTTAQPGGGNPNSNSPNAATPASPSNKNSGQPAVAPNVTAHGPKQPHMVAPGSAGGPVVQPVYAGNQASESVQPAPVPPAPTYDPNSGSIINGTTTAAPVIPAFEPRPMPPRKAGPPPVLSRPMAAPCLSFHGAVLASQGRWLLLPISSSDEMLILNARTNEMITRVRVASGPVAIALSPDGSMAWVACINSAQVVGVNLSSLRAGPWIPVGSRPAALAVTPEGRNLFVANSADATVSVVNLAKSAVVAVVPVGPSPQDVLVSPDGGLVYVVNSGDASVSVLDRGSRRVVSTIRGR